MAPAENEFKPAKAVSNTPSASRRSAAREGVEKRNPTAPWARVGRLDRDDMDRGELGEGGAERVRCNLAGLARIIAELMRLRCRLRAGERIEAPLDWRLDPVALAPMET